MSSRIWTYAAVGLLMMSCSSPQSSSASILPPATDEPAEALAVADLSQSESVVKAESVGSLEEPNVAIAELKMGYGTLIVC